MPTFTAEAAIEIKATTAQVWDALTNPAMIKQYFFGVECISDWKVGSKIIYRGEWQGKTFEDKGNILKLEPEKLLLCNYWSSFTGLPDKPENYQNVKYELSKTNSGTQLSITQDKIPTSEAAEHSKQNWNTVLDALKKLLEK